MFVLVLTADVGNTVNICLWFSIFDNALHANTHALNRLTRYQSRPMWWQIRNS